jgi:exopolysaccharide biosynthesis polyprenyl glycosylphosphotransferase
VQSVKNLASPKAVAEFPSEPVTSLPETALGLLMPAPLQNRRGIHWLRSTATDFALIALNWLLIGAGMVALRSFLPRLELHAYAADAPISLLGIALLHAALVTLVGYTEGLYGGGTPLNQQVRILGKSVVWATIVMGVGYGLQGPFRATMGAFACAGLLHFGLLWTWRWQTWKQQIGDRPTSDMRNVLIVGAGVTGRRVASSLQAHPSDGRELYGFLDDEYPLGNGVIGRVSELARLARTGFVDEVILAAPRDQELAQQVIREARRLRLDVEIVPELFGCKLAANEVDRVGDLPVICLHAEHLPAAALVVKRWVDIVGSGLALLTFSPLLAMIAILIKVGSPGPAFYSAQRAGRKGRLFQCYKFRTMVSNADALKDRLRENNERSGPIFKIAADPRITRLGRFLRRYSLDELPQLWNVLKGDMSLVGPRPHPADDYAAYEIEHLARLDVTPGITGLWQVTARRDASFQRGMELDREYIRTWSLASDARILAKTVLAVVRGSGQ